MPYWKQFCVVVSYGALLACHGTVKASPLSDDLFSLKSNSQLSLDTSELSTKFSLDPASNRNRQPLMEARLMQWESRQDPQDWWMDPTTRNRKLSTRQEHDPFQLRMPLSFEAPLLEEEAKTTERQPSDAAIWTKESIQQFEDRLQQQFGDLQPQRLLKTGTTIAGVCGMDTTSGRPFVVLGADTRATAGRMVADKRCSKIHCLASNLWACGAGTSADLDQITRHCRYWLALKSRIETESIGNGARSWPAEEEQRDPSLEPIARHSASMASACRLLKSQLYRGGGSIGANLIVGGVDPGTGQPHIRAIHPHGSMDLLPYAALGSGGLAAMAVIESRYHNKITLEEGIQIVKEAILAGIQNDMGSGSQVDLCVITTTSSDQNSGNFQVVSNHTRAIVPEEELLPASWKEETKVESSAKEPSKSASTPGVNGFGNYPFAIRSKRVVLASRDAMEEDRLKQWDKALGLEEED